MSASPGPSHPAASPPPSLGEGGKGAGFDVEAVRAQFPILARTVHGRPLVYLDNAASAQKPRAVIQAMAAAIEGSYANVHRGLHTLANETTEAFEAARETVRRFVGAATVDQVVLTSGGTAAVNLVASGLGQTIRPGDEIIVTEMEHHSNIVPWHLLRERRGAVLKWAPVRDDGSLDMEALHALVTERTRMVAVTQMSNVLGTVSPVAEIVRAAKGVRAQVLIDGCQGAVHGAVDFEAMGCDFYVVTGHKLYGPTGVGALIGRPEALEALPPWQGGGEMIEQVSRERVTYARPPHRFEAGTPPILQVIGLGAALDWFMATGGPAAFAHEAALHDAAMARLDAMEGVRVFGRAPGKGPIISFAVDGVHAHDLAQVMDRSGVAVRAGLHCAEPLANRMGYTSSVRASFALYNTMAEVDALADAVTKARNLLA